MIRATLLGAIVFAVALSAAAEDPLIDVGKPFPLIELPIVGKDRQLTSIEPYRGRKLMVHLFASW